MTASNRTAILNKIYKVIKKHYKPVAPPAGRSLLDHLVYACCLENARYEAADEAFAKLQPPCYIDWNEVRVTSKNELSLEVTNKLPDPLAAAASIKQALQGVFETHFAFDIEFLKKQNLGKSEKDVAQFVGGNPFIVSYMVQHALGGHSIPCSQGTIDAMYVVGAITEQEHEKGVVPGLERAIPKNKGIEFGSLLHQLGADFHASPFNTRVRAILLEIDPTSKDRMPKRGAPKKDEGKKKAAPTLPAAIPAPAAKKVARPDARPVGKHEGKSEAKHETKHEAKSEGKSASRPAAPKSKDAKPDASRGAAGPHLAKKKPR